MGSTDATPARRSRLSASSVTPAPSCTFSPTRTHSRSLLMPSSTPDLVRIPVVLAPLVLSVARLSTSPQCAGDPRPSGSSPPVLAGWPAYQSGLRASDEEDGIRRGVGKGGVDERRRS